MPARGGVGDALRLLVQTDRGGYAFVHSRPRAVCAVRAYARPRPTVRTAPADPADCYPRGQMSRRTIDPSRRFEVASAR